MMYKYLKPIEIGLCLWFFVLLVGCTDSKTAVGKLAHGGGSDTPHNVLLLSDIHFNPYAECSTNALPCPSLQKLINNPVEKWPNFLNRRPISNYGEETNNAFLTHGFDNLKDIVVSERVNVVFITGDMLAHEFDKKYYKFTVGKSRVDLTDFSSKTILYVLQELRKRLPVGSKIYLALGNNDVDAGNYAMQSAQFLNTVGTYLSQFIDSSNKTRFMTSFSKGGYFSTPLSDTITLIGLNTNSLSFVKPNENAANEQLKWFKGELINAVNSKRRVIIFQHIPYGVDLYYTAMRDKVIPVLNLNLQAEYLDLLKQYSSIITTVYAGHYHREFLSLVNRATPLIGTIAFNSYTGNNPGFKIVSILSDGSFNGYTTYSSTLGAGSALVWKPLYDYLAVYGNPAKIAATLNNFPYDKSAKQTAYRQYYEGGDTKPHEDINNDTKWKYYYCGIKFVESMSYTKCLKQH